MPAVPLGHPIGWVGRLFGYQKSEGAWVAGGLTQDSFGTTHLAPLFVHVVVAEWYGKGGIQYGMRAVESRRDEVQSET